MKHRIVIRCEGRSLRDFALKQQISKCITAALAHQGVNTPCEINVLVTDDEGIRAINNAYRKIDKATDVLSFPLGVDGKYDISKETGCALLGDVVISLETAMRQADLYGHSLEREIGFLTVHSMLHLLGYDHETSPLEARKMREKEEQVLGELGISREETFVSEE